MSTCTLTAITNSNVVSTAPGAGVVLTPAPPPTPPPVVFNRPIPFTTPPADPYANCILVPIHFQTGAIDPITNQPEIAVGGYFSSNCPAVNSNPKLI